jgi:membrane peptidoglycan carboxypeptidase
VALAELIGILVNDGVRRPNAVLQEIQFANATPYETIFERKAESGQQVLAPEVARTVRKAMASVVESGTARRLQGVFRLSNGKLLTVGGKTGSGDNRIETFNRWGEVTSSRATNRTAAFVFYIGDRYFGVITAYVQGREAEQYHFTSSLPVTLLKILAPTIIAKLDKNAAEQALLPAAEVSPKPAPAKALSDAGRVASPIANRP